MTTLITPVKSCEDGPYFQQVPHSQDPGFRVEPGQAQEGLNNGFNPGSGAGAGLRRSLEVSFLGFFAYTT